MIFSFYSNKRSPRPFAFLTAVFCLAAVLMASSFSKALAQGAGKAVLLTDPEGSALVRFNDADPMIPASTLKLLTSLAALRTLGNGHRSHTRLAWDPQTGSLFIKGFGDPLLISEELERMAKLIAVTYSPPTVRDIVVDASFFSPDIEIPGTGQSNNPYDATTGALCANFNTVHFTWSGRLNTYVSAEPQTPLLDLVKDEIRASGLKQGRILLPSDQRALYPGLLVAEFLKRRGIQMTGKVVSGEFCSTCTSATSFQSGFTLEEIVEKLLAFSNNFMANQILLVMGAEKFGPPATLEKGITALEAFAATQLGIKGVSLVEGSGLSRRNRISARQMHTVLREFRPYHRLLKQQGNDFYKTGTLSDVRTRAGYLVGQDKRLYPYVIMLNHTTKGYERIYGELKKAVFRASSARKE